MENRILAVLTLGEGWHNFHHTFPLDYKTAELGNRHCNISTIFIDCMAKLGWAYDLKTVSPEMIKRCVKRVGDGTHELFGRDNTDEVDMREKHFSKSN